MFFKNKHVITSMIVAPILAIISYFAVDYYVAEVPHKAKDGQLYKMLAKPNCRWESGSCNLINGDLELKITSNTQTYGENQISVVSSVGLESIKYAIASHKNQHSNPKSMTSSNAENTSWYSTRINVVHSDYFQFVINADNSVFYVEVPATFIYKDNDY